MQFNHFWLEKMRFSNRHAPRGASCVQRLDDSQIHANRTTYRTLLRSSSLQEPRDPLLKVVYFFFNKIHSQTHIRVIVRTPEGIPSTNVPKNTIIFNDPSAGSPTETLLRLLLPLNDQVCPIFPSNRLAPKRQIQRPH